MNEFFIYLEDIIVKPGYLKGWRIFQSDFCRSWTEKPFKNSYSRQLRIVNAVVIWAPAGQIDWPKSVFLQDKVMLFETMMTTMNNRDKTKVPDYVFFVMFRLSVWLCWTRWVNWFTIDVHVSLIIKTLRLQPCMQTELRLCFYVLMRYSLLFSSEIILKQLFASGSVNIPSILFTWNFARQIIFFSPGGYYKIRKKFLPKRDISI